MIYLRLFFEFLKTGLFAVGGGLATLPFLYRMGDVFGWFTYDDVGNMLAVSESTPGPIGVNMATYVGNVVGTVHGGVISGIFCGIITTLSLILPSYLIILCVQKVMLKFSENRYIQGAMSTLRPASVGMISAAVIGILQTVLLDMNAVSSGSWSDVVLFPGLLIFFAVFVLNRVFHKFHPVVFLAFGAVAGVLLKL